MRRGRRGRDGIRRWAIFGVARRYRFALGRAWAEDLPTLVFVMLNPSRADERRDDPTIRRCVKLAAGWGYGSVVVVNLFALRACSPAALRESRDPVGPGNDAWIRTMSARGDVVAAWGVHGSYRRRARAVLDLLDGRPVRCLGTTKHGHPRHPLYLRRDVQPQPFMPGTSARAPCGRPGPDRAGPAGQARADRRIRVPTARRSRPARRAGRPGRPAPRG